MLPGLFYAERVAAETGPPPVVHARADPAATREGTQKNSRASPKTLANDGYVGSGACSRCHAEIYNHFSQTKMGRSMTPVTEDFLHAVPVSASVYDAKSDHHFEVRAENGKLLQSEYQVDGAGHEVFRETHPIDWIIGADANGLGGLIQHDGYLFEAPLSYYKENGSWGLSPGYERGDLAFSRVIAPGCIFCHTGRAQPVAGTFGKYENQAFTQLSVGCENCHGPGAQHVRAMGMGDSYARGKDPTIVNPGSLAPALANDLCQSCHQTGDTRVFKPGKSYLDYRPGQPLDRVMAILMVPPTRENPPREDHVEHYYSMILSKCYRESARQPGEKQMRCITCHDPHVEPAEADAPAYFNGKCMSCHTAQSCKEPAAVRAQTAPADNCIGCHMQKRAGVAISHTSITNHRIVARPDEPFPDVAFAMTTPAMPDLIHLDATPGDSKPLPGVTLLEAYSRLKDQSPVYAASYLKTLHELETTEPEHALVQAGLGHQALAAGQLDEAMQHLQEAVKLDPAQAAVYVDLSDVADQKGDAPQAVAYAQKAVMLEPFSAPKQKALVLRLINAKMYTEAEAAMEKYLENFPEDDFMRKMLAIAKQ